MEIHSTNMGMAIMNPNMTISHLASLFMPSISPLARSLECMDNNHLRLTASRHMVKRLLRMAQLDHPSLVNRCIKVLHPCSSRIHMHLVLQHNQLLTVRPMHLLTDTRSSRLPVILNNLPQYMGANLFLSLAVIVSTLPRNQAMIRRLKPMRTMGTRTRGALPLMQDMHQM